MATLKTNIKKIYSFSDNLSKDISDTCDITKTKINFGKITNVRFSPILLDDFFIKDFETLKNDGM